MSEPVTARSFQSTLLARLAEIGTADPVLFVTPAEYAWYEALSPNSRGIVDVWIRHAAADHGHHLAPRVAPYGE